tara:strand:- start:20589 stop:21035 length:447 start_codon:yes stop_codon:yes gene_type:complete
MKKFLILKFYLFCLLISSATVYAQSNHFNEGLKLFDKKKFDKSKIFFERDIVFNPESEKSYLYLAKIFYEKSNDEEQEINLNNVLILNPQNDEAVYMLALLKIKQSDYDFASELAERFDLICKTFCSKKKEINEKLKKLTPENEEVKN